ncbi:MAG: exodeoxyribonuclease VII small subunit [Bacteroidales bacterium]
MAKKITYTEAMAELNAIVDSIQNNKIEIDQLKESVMRARELLKVCKKILHDTDVEVQSIIENIES